MTTFSENIIGLNCKAMTKEEGVQKAYDSSSLEWRDAALCIIYQLSKERQFISADDIVRALESFEELEQSYKALPAVLKIAKKNGWITEAMCTCREEVKTCESRRISSHSRKITVYRSLVV
jgi:hypothetical protein